METRPNFLPATYIKFNTPAHPTEPSIVQLIFDDPKMAHVCYRILRETFADNEITLNFIECGEKEIQFEFVEKKTNKWVTGAKLYYTKDELRDFTDYVDKNDSYAVIFGANINGDFIVNGLERNESIVLFSGYKGNIPNF